MSSASVPSIDSRRAGCIEPPTSNEPDSQLSSLEWISFNSNVPQNQADTGENDRI